MNWHNHLGEIISWLIIYLFFFSSCNIIQARYDVLLLFSGMGLVIKVGNVEETIQPPPKGFPKCGNFVGCDVE